MTRLGRWLALAAVLVWSLAPFVWQILTSLKPTAELETLPPILPNKQLKAGGRPCYITGLLFGVDPQKLIQMGYLIWRF